MIKLGKKGWSVVDLQARLKWLYKNDIIVTGYCCEETDSYIRNFQANHGLVIDGLAGNKTIGVLKQFTKEAHLYTFIHCTASKYSHKHVTGEWVKDYHLKRRMFKRVGYRDFIELDGTLTNLRPYNQDRKIQNEEYTWGVRGSFNRHSAHVCYSGGIAETGEAADTRTKQQAKTMKHYIKTALAFNPSLIIVGHNQVQKKACPSFDVVEWGKKINIANHNLAHWDKNVKRY